MFNSIGKGFKKLFINIKEKFIPAQKKENMKVNTVISQMPDISRSGKSTHTKHLRKVTRTKMKNGKLVRTVVRLMRKVRMSYTAVKGKHKLYYHHAGTFSPVIHFKTKWATN